MPTYTAGDCSLWRLAGPWPEGVGLHWPSGQPITNSEAWLIHRNGGLPDRGRYALPPDSTQRRA